MFLRQSNLYRTGTNWYFAPIEFIQNHLSARKEILKFYKNRYLHDRLIMKQLIKHKNDEVNDTATTLGRFRSGHVQNNINWIRSSAHAIYLFHFLITP